MKEVVSREQAEAEVTSWLDKKKVFTSTRDSESGKEAISALVEAICEGVLVLNEDFTLTHRLLFEAGGEKDLTYKCRLNDNILKPHLQGIKTGDADGRLNAYVAALTSKTKAVIGELDTADKKISMSIAFFFF